LRNGGFSNHPGIKFEMPTRLFNLHDKSVRIIFIILLTSPEGLVKLIKNVTLQLYQREAYINFGQKKPVRYHCGYEDLRGAVS
jgi:hypothetical protein